ncbi:MAG: carboxypeptidase regulatory-like domain-containing protein, partial [Acidobacteria bacterium]|nr:carboxypeptidase regulatory-like domain-containing protein [Acidobacteriota bacterium]
MKRLSAAALGKVLACLLIFCATVRAQIPATRLEGTVRTASTAPIPGAIVTATQDRAGRRAQTLSDSEGRFVFPSLAPGSYTVSAEAEGFRPMAHTIVVLGTSAVISEEITLEPGGSTESETDEALPLRLKNSESEISVSFTRRELDVLPLLDRNPLALSIFQPGVQTRAGDPSSSHVNGALQRSNYLTLDAVGVSDPVDPRLGVSSAAINADSIEQFRAVSSGGSAQYGRNAGAQVMMVTRTGANRWSGSGFEYFRNEALNANDFFGNSSGLRRPKFRQHIFGLSLGGPMLSNRTRIFGNYQGRRTSRQVVRNRTALTPEAKSGLFRWFPPGS